NSSRGEELGRGGGPSEAEPQGYESGSLAGGGERRGVGSGVADREDLPEVAVAVLPVDVLAAEARVDLLVVLATRTAPVREPGRLDAGEDRVEVGVTDAEAKMMAFELLAVGKVHGQRVVDVDRREL